MKEISVYIEDNYIVFRIPFSKIVEDEDLFNLFELLKANQLKKKIKVSEIEFESLIKNFDEILRNKVKNWLEEASIEVK